MSRYFKIVCTNDKKTDWMIDEFKNGRVRFGWGWRDSNLNIIKNKDVLNVSERRVWRYTQFLINRLQKDDYLIIQLERPLRKFLIAKVTDGYEYSKDEGEDFNHIIKCTPITDKYIPLNSHYLSNSLRHDLSKRGHYYEIYPEETIAELNKLIKDKLWDKADFEKEHTIDLEFDRTKELIIKTTIDTISKQWKAKDFEKFTEKLINHTNGIEVKLLGDSGKGWDLLLTIRDPLTDEILLDNIPVQCKNYDGEVNDERPIQDLERCARNTDKNIVYLFIIGEITDEYKEKIEKKQDELSVDLNRNIKFRIVQEDRIAELYLNNYSSLAQT